MRRPIRAAGTIAGVLAAMVVPVRVASACSCAARPVAALVEAADVVFVGAVQSVKTDGEPPSAGLLASFDVSAVYKGAPGREVQIATPADSASCGTVFALHRTYAVFATRDGDALTTNLCAGTTSDTGALSGLTPLASFGPDTGPVGGSPGRTVPITFAAGLIVALLAAHALARGRLGPRPFV